MTTVQFTVWMFLTLLIGMIKLSASNSIPDFASVSYEKYKHHVDRVAAFNCALPEERVVSLHEALGDRLSTHKSYSPAWTVLHRCARETGCCEAYSDFAHSAMATQENVFLEFEVTDFVENKGHVEMEVFEVKNHTSCSCQSIYDVPR